MIRRYRLPVRGGNCCGDRSVKCGKCGKCGRRRRGNCRINLPAASQLLIPLSLAGLGPAGHRNAQQAGQQPGAEREVLVVCVALGALLAAAAVHQQHHRALLAAAHREAEPQLECRSGHGHHRFQRQRGCRLDLTLKRGEGLSQFALGAPLLLLGGDRLGGCALGWCGVHRAAAGPAPARLDLIGSLTQGATIPRKSGPSVQGCASVLVAASCCSTGPSSSCWS